MSFMWPRHMETFRKSGLWNRIEQRLVSLGDESMVTRCDEVFDELIRGGEAGGLVGDPRR